MCSADIHFSPFLWIKQRTVRIILTECYCWLQPLHEIQMSLLIAWGLVKMTYNMPLNVAGTA